MSKLYILTENKDWSADRFILAIGMYSPDYVMVWGHLEDCLDQMIDWLAEERPGYMAANREAFDVVLKERLAELKEAYPTDDESELEDKAWDASLDGWTLGGNCGDIIESDEWSIYAENPDRRTVKDLIAGLEARDYSGTPTVIVV